MTKKAVVIAAAILATAVAGCGRSDSRSADTVATVNGHSIKLKELRREVALKSKKDPSFQITPDTLRDQVDVLVNRHLLLEEAERRNLTQDRRFTDTIQMFWEQTLVRLLVDRLSEEFKEGVSVTDEEIQKFYENLSQKATFNISSSRHPDAIQAVAQKIEEGAEIKWQRTVGPVSFDEIQSEALEEAFSLEPGQVKVYAEGDEYMLVRLVSKEPANPPALAAIREKIRQNIAARKQRSAFENWLSERRKTADVEISLDRFKSKL